MDIELSPLQARVIACLIEKEVSTPEHYPLSLNALTNACNQKNNREPVMALSEAEVQQALDELAKAHLIMEKSGFGSRVVKYHHRFFNSEFSGTRFTPQQMAVAVELLLRGPQTPGELRSRSQRLYKFADVGEVEQVLNDLAAHAEGPFVLQLAREPGRRDSAWAHLFSGEVDADAVVSPAPALQAAPPAESARIDALEQQVAELRRELDALKQALGQ